MKTAIKKYPDQIRRQQESGVALITVLFMFSVVTVVMSGLLYLTRTNIDRVGHYYETEQAFLLCLSGEEVARQLLIEDLEQGDKVDHTHEKWASDKISMALEGGYFEVNIEDAQGKFNINNLTKSGQADLAMENALARIFDLALEDQELSKKLAKQVVDWIDKDKTGGTEEFDYLSEDVSYRPPDMSAGSVSELRWLKDMDIESYQLIRDNVLSQLTVLPEGTKLNINTITPLAVAGIAGLDIATAETVVESIRARKAGSTSISQALPQLTAAEKKAIEPYVGTTTSYFEVRVRAKFGTQYAYLKTLIKRDPKANDGDGSVVVVSRDRGSRFIFTGSRDYNADNLLGDDFELDI